MKNNITLIGINFYPEDSSTGLYSTQMAEYLSKNHTIDVITGFPYYPEWEIRNEYKNKKTFLKEKKDAITIYRYRQYVPNNPTFKNRIIHLLDFTIVKDFPLPCVCHTNPPFLLPVLSKLFILFKIFLIAKNC